MTPAHLPIGLFDSGIGGLTVMKEVALKLPHENLIYLADTAHLPYGAKSPEEIVRYALKNSAFLLQQKVKLLILACHTASSHALKIVQQHCPIPVFGMIDAGLQQILSFKPEKPNIAVIGTASTIQSGVYQSLIQERWPHAKLFPLACPSLAPLIEENPFESEAIVDKLRSSLAPLQVQTIDMALLACTHYPLVQNLFQTVLGPNTLLIDPAKTVAAQVQNWLEHHHLLNPQTSSPSHFFYSTNPSEKSNRLSSLFFALKKIRFHENIPYRSQFV